MSISASDERESKRRKTNHESDQEVTSPEPSRTDVHAGGSLVGTSSPPSSKLSTANFDRSQVKMTKEIGGRAAENVIRPQNMAIQARELVAQVGTGSSSKLRLFQSKLDHIIDSIKRLKDQPTASFSQAETTFKKKNIAIPWVDHRPASNINYSFSFSSIQKLHVRGILSSGLATTDCNSVEIAITMPPSIFQEKDFRNHRAFHKRAYYLACIAAGLSTSLKSQYQLRYGLMNGNPLLPILRLIPKMDGTDIEELEVVINVLIDRDVGPIPKMLPDKNCVRSVTNESDDAVISLDPTPFYNSTLRSNASALDLDQLVEEVSQKSEAFKDVCILGQVWLRQRGFASSLMSGGFGAEEWILVTALLLTSGGHRGQPLFSNKYTSIQLFKAVLQILSGRDLVKNPLVIGGDLPEMPENEMPVFFDMKRGVNVMFGMTPWSYAKLRHFAELTLTALNARNQNNFEATFTMQSSNSHLQYDEVYSVEAPKSAIHDQSSLGVFLTKLYPSLKQGLSDRARLISFQVSELSPWVLSSSTSGDVPRNIQIGLLVNSEVAARTIDHGPSAEEQEEAKRFRDFWGDKSELRRFRDGRITETLVWSDKTPVTAQIIEHLAVSRFNIIPNSVTNHAQGLESRFLSGVTSLSARDAFTMVNTKFQELASRLHQLEGLPLPIRSVSPNDSILRSVAISHPLAIETTLPVNIQIQFDSTARWPDHLPAIQYTKLAFLTKLADLLSEAYPSYTTRIGIENTESSPTGFLNTSFLDIIQPSPAAGLSALVFRLRIHHDREVDLLQSQLSSKLTSTNTKASITTALATFKQQFIASPAHTAAIRNLVTHFAPFSATARLLKSWVASHHLTNHLPEPVLEIIVAHVFLHPYPWSVPGTSTTAFLRCLHFLAHWDWALTPLVVDLTLTQEMPVSAYTELNTRFLAWRKLDPAMNNVSWFMGTNVDSTGTIWTQGAQPPRVIATRVSALARASIDHVRNKDVVIRPDTWDSLFKSGVDNFDLVIHLKPSFVKGLRSLKQKKDATKYKNLVVQEDMDTDNIGHDVVQLYLEDLERLFGTSILFFRGYGTKVITGLWKPNTRGVKEWRVRLGYSSLPFTNDISSGEQDEAQCEVNKDGIMAEIAKLGEGIIERIEAT